MHDRSGAIPQTSILALAIGAALCVLLFSAAASAAPPTRSEADSAVRGLNADLEVVAGAPSRAQSPVGQATASFARQEAAELRTKLERLRTALRSGASKQDTRGLFNEIAQHKIRLESAIEGGRLEIPESTLARWLELWTRLSEFYRSS